MFYHCVMNNINVDAQAPGAAASEDNAPSVGTITEYLKKDLSVAISCLTAIQSDQDLMNHLAQFMHGRFINALEAKKRDPQPVR